jgi:outer membrane cobalamin receptor
MKRFYYFFLTMTVVLLSSMEINAQTCLVQGKVTDEQTGEALPFVNIGIKGLATGTFSNDHGLYQIELSKGETVLIISCVGYDKQEKHLNVDGKKKLSLDIQMTPTSQELSTFVVSGSKYEQKVENSTSTIEVLKSPSIMVSNPSSIDKAIEKIPGITIVNNEPQIRGGSGFSSGLGSRVMIMVDDIPMLTGNAGRPDWGFLPVDDVDQIEVVKGASSVVYGSSAITGVVNIRTDYPTDQPSTNANAFIGVYSKPARNYATPWTGMNPVIYGLSVSHLQQVDNFDLGIGISFYNDQGYIRGSQERGAVDTNFNKGAFTKRAKMYFNTRVRNKKIKGLTYGVNGSVMYNEYAEAYFWGNADTNLYRAYPGSLSHFKETTFYVDPYVKYFTKNGNSYSLKNRVYFGNSDANNNQSSLFLTVYNELQHTHNFQKVKEFILVVGFTNIYSYSFGKVFSGKLDSKGTTTANENGTYNSENIAAYAQFEKKFFDRLTLQFGGRWEYYQISDLVENSPIFRGGVNLRVGKSTFFRVSAGEGYRAPSIGERYITTNSGGFGFYPNPDLKSETCVSYEVGVKQLFKFGKFVGMADIAGFLENYKNYIEFNFGDWGTSTLGQSLGFRFLNTGPAQIYGVDMSLGGSGKIAQNLDLSVLVGYTYSVPMALHPNDVYYTNTESGTGKITTYTFVKTSSDPSGNILKYRIQSLFKSDLQLTFKKKFGLGLSGNYYGYMKNIDLKLEQLDTPVYMNSGIIKYREEHNKGNFIVDTRLSYSYRDFKFSFLVKNFFNTEYSLRPMTIEAPRTTSLQVLLHI